MPSAPKIHRPPQQDAVDKARADEEIQRQRDKAKRYDHKWRKFSRAYRRAHPLCRPCEDRGDLTPTTAVHHIIDVVDAPSKMYDLTNLMPVCDACHAKVSYERMRAKAR